MRNYLRKAVAVKDKGMQQLSRCQGHQHPTPPPPGFISKPAVVLEFIVCKLGGPCSDVDGYGNAELITRIGPQGEPGQAGADGRSEAGRERFRDARIPLTEGSSLFGEEIGTQAKEESEKKAIEKEDQRERE